MRGFNEKLFGDKLVAGQLPTQLGLIGSSNFGFDIDAQAFFDRVTAAGGTLSATEQSAVNTLVIQMKADGIWTKMKAVYPMVGASAAACAQNLKSSSFTGTFNGGWTFSSNGVTPNGVNAYFNTNFNTNNLSVSDNSFSLYLRTIAVVGVYPVDLGVFSTNFVDRYGINYLSGDGTSYFDIYNRSSFANTNVGVGMIQYSRTSSSLVKIIYKNSYTFTSTNSTQTLQNPNNILYLSALNAGSISNYSNRQNAFASLGEGLTDQNTTDFYIAVQAFQTTLSRQV
jgi:hypothetical protein